MRKIPTLFLRDEHDRRYVTREVNPDAKWVLDGEGVATRKYDGTCMMLDEHGSWWARREVKPGKQAPARYRPISTDETTGKTVGWEPVDQSAFAKAFRTVRNIPNEPGTYELCGPRVNGNPEGYDQHVLVSHGRADWITPCPRDFDGLWEMLTDPDWHYEGVVWRWPQPDGSVRMVKIKRRDFPRG